MTKTILHIFSGDLWAGAEVMIYNLLRCLKNYPGLSIIALSMNEGELTERLRKENVELYIIDEQQHSFLTILLKTKSLFKYREIDIIHSHRYKENLLALLAGRMLGISKLVTTVHGLQEVAYNTGSENSISWKANVDYYILKKKFTVVAVSEAMKKVFVKQLGFMHDMVKVIHNGIDVSNFFTAKKFFSDDSILHIGTVGRLVPVKGFDLFLAIACEVRNKVEGIKFSILGDGPMRDFLKNRAEELGLNGFVEFKGHLNNPQSYYQGLDIFINTSFHEGIPMSVLEAMACGVPVIAPKVGGIPEIIRNGIDGFLVKREKDSFVKACMNLISNRELLFQMSENCKQRIKDYFSAERMAEQYRQLYNSI